MIIYLLLIHHDVRVMCSLNLFLYINIRCLQEMQRHQLAMLMLVIVQAAEQQTYHKATVKPMAVAMKAPPASFQVSYKS